MPQPKASAAYQDLIEAILYPALAAERGVAVACPTPGDAFSLKMRLYAAIRALRRQTQEIYEPDHPRYGTSDFDALVLRTEGSEVIVRKADDLSSFFQIRNL